MTEPPRETEAASPPAAALAAGYYLLFAGLLDAVGD